MTLTQAHIFYSGVVQGVGFRYTVQSLAVPMGLTGWVKNLPDGRVEILVQGPKEIIDKLMAAVDHRFEGSIRKKDVEFSPLLSRFQDFEIAF